MITAHTCPVLAFTPEIEADLGLFELTHELRAGAGWARWERTTLPTAGGIDEQPTRTMAALGWIAALRNRAIADHLAWQRSRAETRRAEEHG